MLSMVMCVCVCVKGSSVAANDVYTVGRERRNREKKRRSGESEGHQSRETGSAEFTSAEGLV